MINLLSAISCLVIGTLMVFSYLRHGQYIAAAISLPLCFALWGIVHLVWRRAGIDSNRVRFAVFHPIQACRTCLPEGAEVESDFRAACENCRDGMDCGDCEACGEFEDVDEDDLG
jgi:hypothetical protein